MAVSFAFDKNRTATLAVAITGFFVNSILTAQDAVEIDAAAVAARSSIGAYEITIHLTSEANIGKDKYRKANNTLHYIRDGAKTLLRKTTTDANGQPALFIECKNCEAAGQFLSFLATADSPAVAASYSPMSNNSPKESTWRYVGNPLLIGFVQQDFWLFPSASMTTVIGNANRKNLSAYKDELNGVPVVRVECRMDNDAAVKYWVAPSQGHSVVRMDYEEGKYFVRTTLKPKKYAATGVWFPESYDIAEHRDGVVFDRTHADIEVASINQPIPPARFTTAGVGLPPGTPVANRPTATGLEVWDGTSLVPHADYASRPAPPAPGGMSKWYGRLMIVFAIIGVIFLASYLIIVLRRRTHSKMP